MMKQPGKLPQSGVVKTATCAGASSLVNCVSCGAAAVLSNYDGDYCKDCMQLHLLEKMFVNLTAIQGRYRQSAIGNRKS